MLIIFSKNGGWLWKLEMKGKHFFLMY